MQGHKQCTGERIGDGNEQFELFAQQKGSHNCRPMAFPCISQGFLAPFVVFLPSSGPIRTQLQRFQLTLGPDLFTIFPFMFTVFIYGKIFHLHFKNEVLYLFSWNQLILYWKICIEKFKIFVWLPVLSLRDGKSCKGALIKPITEMVYTMF